MIRSPNQIRVVETAGQKQAVTGNPSFASVNRRVAPQPVLRSQQGKKLEQAFLTSQSGSNLSNQLVTALGQNPAFYDTYLTGLASELEPTNYRFYQDIYNYDTIAGAAVDLMAAMPFSDFTLSGVQDDRLDTYVKATERLNLKTFFPEMTVDYLVMGHMIGTLVYSSKDHGFTDLLTFNPANAELTPVPMRSRDPIIKIKQSDDMKKFLTSQDERVISLRRSMNKNLLDALDSDEFVLDPVSAIYMPRKSFSFRSTGTSIFKRLMPIYFLEKTLFKGTIVEAGRRQRSLLHLAVGDDTWEPMVEELQAIVGLFQQADLDPLGAIIATRNGVQPNELRQGGDFWKWTDITDQLATMKLRGMGISEAFLAGDATYDNMQTTLSVLLDNFRAYRERVTQTVFYNKIFPLIAAVNGYTKSDDQRVLSSTKTLQSDRAMRKINDTSKWDIPTVNWSRSLGRDQNEAYLDTLDKLKEHGIPVTLRMIAAAGNVDLDTLADDLKKDQELKAKWAAIIGKDKNSKGSDDDEQFAAFGSLFGRRRALLGRDFGEAGEVVATTKTGQRKYVRDQSAAKAKENQMIVSAMRTIQRDPAVMQQNLRRVAAACGGKVPDLYGTSGR